MKNIRTFYLKIFLFLVVKFSVYLNRRVFVMNSSYSLRLIILKLYRCFNHGLVICMCVLQNLDFSFRCFTFFHIFNLDFLHASILWKCICSRYLVSATPPTVLYRSFWNFTGVLIIVWRYACAFTEPCIFFFTFFYIFNLDYFLWLTKSFLTAHIKIRRGT